MKKTDAREKWALSGLLGVLSVLSFCFIFSISRMPDESLQNASSGRESEIIQKGDWILSLRWARTSTLAVGDLVWIKADADSRRTVRRIERVVPPEPLSGPQPRRRLARAIREMDVQPKFVVSALDGSERCEVWPSRIAGKVAHVFRTK